MNNYIHPLQQAAAHRTPAQHTKKVTGTPFKTILNDASTSTDVKVSKHAKERLTERNISINDAKWQTIGNKMQEAKEKGITDALVLTDEAALIVSTKNNTVVTALHQDEAAEKIFTNINGTILI